MCGVTGFLSFKNQLSEAESQLSLQRMADAVAHRGPDGSGFWHDASAGCFLAHRRLSIIELSDAGSQPMLSSSGRLVISFNGEVYNHSDLRAELSRQHSISWRGNSDTETLLAAFEVWGVSATLKKVSGMFALALWDREARQLTLARDRLGEKPMYFGWQGQGSGSTFLFGSDLASLAAHPSFERRINRHALGQFFKYNCIGGEASIYEGVRKLLPGQSLTLRAGQIDPAFDRWWSVDGASLAARTSPFEGSSIEAINKLETLLLKSVKRQSLSDVPMGAFLSGGIDSSLITAMMQSQSLEPVKTFSIGFHDDHFNEAQHAALVAKHLGTDHTEMYVTPDDALRAVQKMPSVYAEPFADSSQIPTFLVSELARRDVTVALSGDGGDELFCGYNRYRVVDRFWRVLGFLPLSLRKMSSKALLCCSAEWLDGMGESFGVKRFADKAHKAASLLESTSLDQLYDGFVSHWAHSDSLVAGSRDIRASAHHHDLMAGYSAVERLMLMDQLGYLPDDILVKVDRAAMGVGLETRAPFLDHDVVEFAWSLPMNYKINQRTSKWVLREVLYRYVPQQLVERPKMGFGIPVGHWLRGPLREWGESLIHGARLRNEGFLEESVIRSVWNEHQSGRRNLERQLWPVLMFQAWLDAWA